MRPAYHDAMPPISPPPPTETNNVSILGASASSSKPTVPCPSRHTERSDDALASTSHRDRARRRGRIRGANFRALQARVGRAHRRGSSAAATRRPSISSGRLKPTSAFSLAQTAEMGQGPTKERPPFDAPTGGIAADSLAPKRVGDLVYPIAREHVTPDVVLVTDDG
jgi:hypothetical protein